MTLRTFDMVLSILQFKRKHSVMKYIGQGNFSAVIFDAHLSQTLVNVY